MHFATFPILTGSQAEFQAEMEKKGVSGKRIVDAYGEALGKWIDLK
jgi:hypothetical protein